MTGPMVSIPAAKVINPRTTAPRAVHSNQNFFIRSIVSSSLKALAAYQLG